MFFIKVIYIDIEYWSVPHRQKTPKPDKKHQIWSGPEINGHTQLLEHDSSEAKNRVESKLRVQSLYGVEPMAVKFRISNKPNSSFKIWARVVARILLTIR